MTVCQKLPKPPPTGRRPTHPWATMKVGEMFFVERERNTMMPLASTTGKKLGRKFSTRMVWMYRGKLMTEGERDARSVYGVGIWREA